jgi:hypothetical protein
MTTSVAVRSPGFTDRVSYMPMKSPLDESNFSEVGGMCVKSLRSKRISGHDRKARSARSVRRTRGRHPHVRP